MRPQREPKFPERSANHVAWSIGTLVLALSWFVACEGDLDRPVRTNTFVNERDGLPDELANRFVSFALEYPSEWRSVPEARRGGMFVQLVGPAPIDGPAGETVSIYPFVLEPLAPLELELAAWGTAIRQARGFARVTVRNLEIDEASFPSVLLDGSRGGETSWGRVVLVPLEAAPDGGRRGLVVELIGSAGVPGLDGPEALGRRGGGSIVLRSVRSVAGS